MSSAPALPRWWRVAFAWGALFPLAAAAQLSGPVQPDLNELALDWARGRYASPTLCEFEGGAQRGLRRVVIGPGPRHARRAVGRIAFVDMEVDDAQRCFTELERAVPNLIGSLQIRLPGTSHRDTARRDFAVALRRRMGFAFEISSGELHIREVGTAAERRVNFRGGRARLHQLSPADDATRLLADFPGRRKLLLQIEAPDGTRLKLPLFLAGAR